ncbi:LytTR family transcriptional regulator DNA-binding domain-containing protein [Paenibacillus sp. GSMTC-2017]|uniref:LytTR family DNA-binding domain-containing protein n=1 Tax=Paenibacillus sp. GSMTC-2017 TaxID=2794350 RepID=UPI0018DA0562|nr:LytTR family DNA-binding domain-containing protein [Paenibacillus sp. GSMTC-2017]MBH5319426.1 LytTR family transcriptional regulator DNA-binding domain-containing protein [Paenibacillus sp. GSMTC-2017]
MVQLLCSHKVYDKLKHELAKYQIEIKDDSDLVLVEEGYDIPSGKLSVVFDAIDYMDVVKLLVSGVREDIQGMYTVTGLSENKFVIVEPKDVLYIEASAEGIMACTKVNRYSIKETLHYYESIWAAKGFIRINKSQLVNLLHVKEIIPWFNSRYVLRMDNNVELEVSKMFSKKLRTTLNI